MIVQLKIDGLVMPVYMHSTAPTSTTNMTGFLIWTLGSSFLNASGVDLHSIFGSSRPPPTRCGRLAPAGELAERPGYPGSQLSQTSVKSFCEDAQRERGEVGQADEDEDHADEHADE